MKHIWIRGDLVEKAARIQPFVAWAGGKQQLLPEIRKEIKRAGNFTTYYEPFVGGGSVLFDLLPKRAVINDYNIELINAYQVIKTDVDDLIVELAKGENTAEEYYRIRALDRAPGYQRLSKVKKAARFIYLNKTCFNGLYRVNKQGYFNAAYGKRKKVKIVQADNLHKISQYLNNNDIRLYTRDFADILKNVKPDSLVYFDPPYVPANEIANFTRYTDNQFRASDQQRLAEKCQQLNKKGVKFIASNSDTSAVHKLYKDFNFRRVSARRYINVKGTGRKKIDEVIITNF